MEPFFNNDDNNKSATVDRYFFSFDSDCEGGSLNPYINSNSNITNNNERKNFSTNRSTTSSSSSSTSSMDNNNYYVNNNVNNHYGRTLNENNYKI